MTRGTSSPRRQSSSSSPSITTRDPETEPPATIQNAAAEISPGTPRVRPSSRWPPVRVGQFVGAGAIIGYVGMTGWTTGPHVHFMTIVNGQAVNPRPYLP